MEFDQLKLQGVVPKKVKMEIEVEMENYKSKTETHNSSVRALGRILTVAMAVFLLAACASSRSLYVPAADNGDIGYTESRLSADRYRVVYKGDSGTPLETVQDYALLRAAELTVAQNFDWFEVAERSSTPISEQPNTARAAVQVSTGSTRQTNCGLLGCTTTQTQSAPAFPQSQVEFSEREQSYVSSIEVLMGEGSHERSADIYDPRDVIASIRAEF